MLRTTLLITGFAILSAGCATISEETCLAGNWEKLGYEDSTQGRSSDRLGTIIKDCAKHDIEADRISYISGYDAGLPQYCTYDNGLNRGLAGNSRLLECDQLGTDDYARGHAEGLEEYRIRAEYQSLIDGYDKLRSQILELERQLEEDDTLTDTDKTALRRDIRTLDGELIDRRVDIRTFEADLGWPKADLD